MAQHVGGQSASARRERHGGDYPEQVGPHAFAKERTFDWVIWITFIIFGLVVIISSIQRREMQSANFSFSKSIDTFCPIGPWIVTADEIPDPYDLDLELRVNGEKRQISNTSHMSVTIPQIISKFSPAPPQPAPPPEAAAE